ncbi:MAG: zinc-binding dehydrogenase [Sediminibacterium sp.]|jgi:NADPH:quinone reductase|nr:zinc-binding dehydrogenase [Chitinophagaceae bacterium]
MKALLCTAYGLPENLAITEIDLLPLQDKEVRIAIYACGVNFPDALIIQNKYQFKPPLPFSPGGEVAGIIVAVGNAVKHLSVGTRVLALSIWGGFAEEINVDASRVFPIPPAMDFITAASTLYTFGTSYHALKDRASLKRGETVLILGAAGGVGSAAIMLAKQMGATVIAAASTADKLVFCKEIGADFCINYNEEDLRARLKSITDDKGVDIVYDAVGGKLAEPAFRSIAWNGRYLVVGFATGEIPQLPFNLPLLKGASIVGVFWGSFAEREPSASMQNSMDIVKWLQEGKIYQPIYKIYSLEEAATAIGDLMLRKVLGKAVVEIKKEKQEPLSTRSSIPTKSKVAEQAAINKLVITGKKEIKEHIGKIIGPSDWLTITQEMIDAFANTTLDFQWVHTDVEKAKLLLPEGKTIAHGFLSLSLVSQFFYQLIQIENIPAFFNYGLNKVRFIAPVPVNSKIRLVATLSGMEELSNGHIKLFINSTIMKEGSEKPVLIAEIISLIT